MRASKMEEKFIIYDAWEAKTDGLIVDAVVGCSTRSGATELIRAIRRYAHHRGFGNGVDYAQDGAEEVLEAVMVKAKELMSK